MPMIGDKVRVWPGVGLRVSSLPPPAFRALPAEGAEVAWSPWLASRLRQGDVYLHDPRPKSAPMKE